MGRVETIRALMVAACVLAWVPIGSAAQESPAVRTLETSPPIAILNPGHDTFVIPPFRVEGRAIPGEKLGVFINGYPHYVIHADEEGRFSTRIAWTHEGPVWIEVRRGDRRAHAVRVRVAEVTPPVMGRNLSSEPAPFVGERILEEFEPVPDREADPVVTAARPTRSSQVDALEPRDESGGVTLRSTTRLAEPRYDKTQQVAASLFGGYALQALAFMWGNTLLTQDDGGAGSGMAVMLGMQSASAYILQSALGGDSSALLTIAGAAVPTLVGLAGLAYDRPELMALGMATQPLGATVGAAF